MKPSPSSRAWACSARWWRSCSAKKGIVLAAGLLLGAFSCQMGILYESSQAVAHMDPLVAILRSNFLLSTHVITIVLGYAAGLLAAVLSHVYLLASPLRLIGRKTEQSLDRMAYGILCFSPGIHAGGNGLRRHLGQ